MNRMPPSLKLEVSPSLPSSNPAKGPKTDVKGKRQDEILKRFTERYSADRPPALQAVEREAIGAVVGANGYTTVAQAEHLLDVLSLQPGTRLLDIGAGRGWPGLYLADRSGCRAVVTDIPRPAIAAAYSRVQDLGLTGRCQATLASGSSLPFRNASFDAVVHADAL
jgi:protein-L-isoaspartate O-methyltransferase